jgi:hypothetical protein
LKDDLELLSLYDRQVGGNERPIRYFVQDESRFGLKTLIGRVLRLLASNQLEHGSGYLADALRSGSPTMEAHQARHFGFMEQLNLRLELLSSSNSLTSILSAFNGF